MSSSAIRSSSSSSPSAATISVRRAQVVLQAPGDDLALVVEVVDEHVAQPERAGHAVHERDGVEPEGGLERGVLEELVQRDLRNGVALEVDLDPHPGLVRQVLE